MRNDLNISIGKRIRKQREKLGYSRESLSEKIEVSSRFLADIELGTKGMSFSTLIKLSKELNVSIDYIICGQEDESESETIKRAISKIDKVYLPELEKIIIAFEMAVAKAEETEKIEQNK